MHKHINLGSRVKNICEKRGISWIKCIYDRKYLDLKQNRLCNGFTPEGQNGLVDSVRALFSNYNKTNCDIACHIIFIFIECLFGFSVSGGNKLTLSFFSYKWFLSGSLMVHER